MCFPAPANQCSKLRPGGPQSTAKQGVHPGEWKSGVSPVLEGRFSLLPYPRLKCQVSSRGGVGFGVCLCAQPLLHWLERRLKPFSRVCARVHAYTHTHRRAHLHTRVHRHKRSEGRAPALRSRRASLTFGASQRAGRAGRGAGGGEIDNRFGGLQGISLLEPKPHKPNPLQA